MGNERKDNKQDDEQYNKQKTEVNEKPPKRDLKWDLNPSPELSDEDLLKAPSGILRDNEIIRRNELLLQRWRNKLPQELNDEDLLNAPSWTLTEEEVRRRDKLL